MMVHQSLTEEWRCVWMECGVMCAPTNGTMWMPVLSALSSASILMVYTLKDVAFASIRDPELKLDMCMTVVLDQRDIAHHSLLY